jgi:D-3-phosphoglycerate dehydrogenase
MKTLIADKLPLATIHALEALGCDVVVKSELDANSLPSAIMGFDILIVRSTQVTRQTIEAGKELSLIIRAGAGVNTIDLEAASQRGIHVSNCPGKNTEAVAELAIGLLLACDRRIPQAAAEMRGGQWKKGEFGKARGVKGRMLGVIGLGNIGMAVIALAKALEMDVVAWSRSLTPEKAEALGIAYAASPLAIAAQADAVSLHVAYSKELRHLVNAEFLAALKPGAILINTARGDLMDTAALKEAIKSKGLRVGLDVFENEPKSNAEPFVDTELATLAICTPHIGASTDQASEAITEEAVRIVRSYLETGMPVNVVNVRIKPITTHKLVARHYNRVGVLSSILFTLKGEGINIEEMQNTIFACGTTATCSLRLDKLPSPATVALMSAHADIIQVTVC